MTRPPRSELHIVDCRPPPSQYDFLFLENLDSIFIFLIQIIICFILISHIDKLCVVTNYSFVFTKVFSFKYKNNNK